MPNSKINNPNCIHSCPCKKINLSEVTCSSILQLYKQQTCDIYDFYIAHAPIEKSMKKDGEKKNDNPLRCIGEYGWTGQKDLQKLEIELLKVSEIPSFYMLRSDSISGTLESMALASEICIEHPRAVMLINKAVSINEDGTVEIKPRESRVACLFRHIRNSLAHGLTYQFENKNILIEDREAASGKITARILIEPETLLKWIYTVDKNEIYYKNYGVINHSVDTDGVGNGQRN